MPNRKFVDVGRDGEKVVPKKLQEGPTPNGELFGRKVASQASLVGEMSLQKSRRSNKSGGFAYYRLNKVN